MQLFGGEKAGRECVSGWDADSGIIRADYCIYRLYRLAAEAECGEYGAADGENSEAEQGGNVPVK